MFGYQIFRVVFLTSYINDYILITFVYIFYLYEIYTYNLFKSSNLSITTL